MEIITDHQYLMATQILKHYAQGYRGTAMPVSPGLQGYCSSLSVAHGGHFDTASPATCSWLPHFLKL